MGTVKTKSARATLARMAPVRPPGRVCLEPLGVFLELRFASEPVRLLATLSTAATNRFVVLRLGTGAGGPSRLTLLLTLLLIVVGPRGLCRRVADGGSVTDGIGGRVTAKAARCAFVPAEKRLLLMALCRRVGCWWMEMGARGFALGSAL